MVSVYIIFSFLVGGLIFNWKLFLKVGSPFLSKQYRKKNLEKHPMKANGLYFNSPCLKPQYLSFCLFFTAFLHQVSQGKKASDVLGGQLTVHSPPGASDFHAYLGFAGEMLLNRWWSCLQFASVYTSVSGNQKVASPNTFTETPKKICCSGTRAREHCYINVNHCKS